MRAVSETPMRSLRNPFLLVTLGVALSVASCTLITDVDRSEIPTATGGGAGAPSTGGTPPTETGGQGGMGGQATGGQGGMGGQGGAAAGMGGA